MRVEYRRGARWRDGFRRIGSPTSFHTSTGECILRFLNHSLWAYAGHVLGGVLALMASTGVHAEQVICHYTYGGITQQLAAKPVSSPYAVKGIKVGSYFHFRVVFQNSPADVASVKVYTYSERDDGLVLIHQATFPYPPAASDVSPYGFSGLHFVYEPMRDGELQYWCQLTPSAPANKSGSKYPQ
jgi:hypothetical protein